MIITHRGLDPSRAPYFAESSREAFADQLSRGFGIEFDIRITKDAVPVISHDETLIRTAKIGDPRPIAEMTAAEFKAVPLSKGSTLTLEELLELMAAKQASDVISALHLKWHNQTPDQLDVLTPYLKRLGDQCFVFDAAVPTASFLKQKIPNIILAASVVHPYDITRYGSAVGGTLLSPESVNEHRHLYDWVWLDEWDRTDAEGARKSLYTAHVFEMLHAEGFCISVVSPELHATSPSLLGGESHEDARNMDALEKRAAEIASLKPEAICTDYPDKYAKLVL